MSEATRVTEKGQTTIPKDLREKYDLEPGDDVLWMDTADGIVVKKRTSTAGRGRWFPTTPRAKIAKRSPRNWPSASVTAGTATTSRAEMATDTARRRPRSRL